MGCAGSKLDELEAVALCKHRSQSLEDAINYRFALANAHESYIQSLRSVGLSLHRFFLISDPPPSSSSPLLSLPTQRKGGPFHPPLQPAPSPFPPPPPPVAAVAVAVSKSVPEDAHRHSNSGHLEFHTSDEDDLSDYDDDGPLHSDDHDSPFHHRLDTMDGAGTTKSTTTTYFNLAKKGSSTSAVTYEQRPFGLETSHVQFSGFDPSSTASTSSGYYYGDPYMNQDPNYYGGGGGGEGTASYPYPYPPPYAYPQGYGGFFDSSPPVVAAPPAAPSPPSSRAPPPPPSPPQASAWDFLNPFESYQNYQQQSYTPSRSSRELREEEGIPDLEDEEHEVVKEAYGDQKFAPAAFSSNANGTDGHSSTKGVVTEGRRSIGNEDVHYRTRGICTVEREVPLTDKNVVVDEVLQRQSGAGPRKKIVPGSRSVPDAVLEIKEQFDRASLSCEEIGKMLEVGKLPYHRRKYEVVSSKMRYAITLSLSTAATSKNLKKDGLAESSKSVYLDFDEEKGMTTGHLSQTLQKLYIWEKKLLEEVRAEEEMRLYHDKKCKRFKRLDDSGAEPSKIDSTRAIVKKLSTKIIIAIQAVDSISNKISKLRDEELWPELHELIQGLVGMWRAMTECHRSQFQAVVESSNLNAVAYAFTGKLTDEHMKATMQLAMELLNWIDIFSSWIDAQKSYVKSLNSWLIKCLPNEQEETADGFAPFSPGRLGAPPVFVICNYWSQTIDRISEREVLEAMQSFTSSVMHVWKQHSDARNIGMVTNQVKDKLLKDHEKDDKKFRKAVDAINKRLVQVARQHGLPYTGDIINIDPSIDPNHLHESLQQIFEVMERFSDNSLRAYEELCVRCDEESSRDNERVS